MDNETYERATLINTTVTFVAAAGMYLVLNQRPRKTKREWIKSFLKRRATRGAMNTLIRELSNYPNDYRNYLRMNEDTFKHLLSMVTTDITKSDTTMRLCVPAADKLAVTLRYLATGESFTSLQYQFRIGRSTLSSIIREMPSSEREWLQVADEFEKKWNFPNVIGAIDGISSGSKCLFPRQWWGRWYLAGVGEVIIKATDINTKGYCYDQYRDYYLIENRREHCHQCMQIIHRHTNVIQYMESFCIGKTSLQSICSQILVENNVQTLIRNAALPVPCPLQKAFYMTYNNQTGGFCRSPMSYVHQCSALSRLVFNFKQCSRCTNTFDRVLEMECLATWRNANNHFAYGHFIGDGHAVKETSYRCFIYQRHGNIVYVSISSDGSCQDVRSAKEGPIIMELTEDIHGWPKPKCSFPPWLSRTSWVDIVGLHSYQVPSTTDVIISERRHWSAGDHVGQSSDVVLYRMSCLALESYGNQSRPETSTSPVNTSDNAINDVIIIAHVIRECNNHFLQCIGVAHYSSRLIQFNYGNVIRSVKDRCSIDNSNHMPTTSQVSLVAAGGRESQRGATVNRCPLKGRYTEVSVNNVDSLSANKNCQIELRSGCNHPDRIDVTSTCSHRPALSLVCLSWWKQRYSTYYLLASRYDTNQTVCYQLLLNDSRLSVERTNGCLVHQLSPPLSPDALHTTNTSPLITNAVKDKCKRKVARTEPSSVDTATHNANRAGSQKLRQSSPSTKGSVVNSNEAIVRKVSPLLLRLLELYVPVLLIDNALRLTQSMDLT